MSTRSEREKSQKQNEQHQAILSKLLREEDNKYCADCEAKGPRWASWNLGVFICIRCAGIHRNLGVHISRVKSVNLDQWTPEQIQCMQDMGNTKARYFYEANLPEHFRRPQTDQAVEFFIRDKYEKKKYVDKNANSGITITSSDAAPLPSSPSLSNTAEKSKLEREKDKRKDVKKRGKDEEKPIALEKVKMSPPHAVGLPPSILNLTGEDLCTEKGCTVSEALKKDDVDTRMSSQKVEQSTIDLLGLDTPIEVPAANGSAISSTRLNEDLDIFGPMVSNPLPTSDSQLHQPISTKPTGGALSAPADLDLFTEPTTKSEDSAKKPLSKDSILSLYGTGTMQQQQGTPAAVFMAPSSMSYVSHPAASYPNFPNLGTPMPAPTGMMGNMMGQSVGMVGQPAGMVVGIGMANGFMGNVQTGAVRVPENMVAPQAGMVGNSYNVQQSQQPQWNLSQVNQQMAGMNLSCPTGVMSFSQAAGTKGGWTGNPTGQTLSTQLWK
ncbi:stromal membrane-associated protein 1 isoform X1 [Chiloscyllium plagiosum]|uniref:stromal membrane-associated protein 1 isoform X1 n=1 Tax=Chiloscyllium plagiosum TaxID=36176 RepID=UPI001CB83908|nr:stromal membrane-associated protein 1 isoform X1 [Chiloscyllium plagiosum]